MAERESAATDRREEPAAPVDAATRAYAARAAGCLAHAIRNPLCALIGTVESARDLDAGVEGAALERLHLLARRIDELLTRTLKIVQGHALEREPCAPEALLAQVRDELAAVAREARVEIAVEVSEQPPPLPIDRELLASALAALAENAVQWARRDGHVWLLARPHGQGWELRVEDDGPGVAPDLCSRVFEPFFSTRSAGSGLGLSLAREIVALHGGRLELGRREGSGASLRVTLPA